MNKKIIEILEKNKKVTAEYLALQCGYESDEDAVKRNLSRYSLRLYNDVVEINKSDEMYLILWEIKKGVMYYYLATTPEEVKNLVYHKFIMPAVNKLKVGRKMLQKLKFDGWVDFLNENVIEIFKK